MDIQKLISERKGEKSFSFEVLPPLKGNGTANLFSTIDKLKDFDPLFINIQHITANTFTQNLTTDNLNARESDVVQELWQ